MIVFGILHNKSGNWLPPRNGGSFWDGTDKVTIPRLFTSHHAAKCFIGQWVRGEHRLQFSIDLEFSTENRELTITEMPGRSHSDLSIIKLELRKL